MRYQRQATNSLRDELKPTTNDRGAGEYFGMIEGACTLDRIDEPIVSSKPTRSGHGPSTLAIFALCVVAMTAAACESSQIPKAQPNFIVVVVDTLRADRLGAYGNTDNLTPFIDSLADRAFVFKNAYAVSSWTFPSIASILTARFPEQHRVVLWESLIPESDITFPEILSEAGYDTFAFQANALVSPGRGFSRGFDLYRTYEVKKKAGGAESHARTFHARAGPLNREALVSIRANRSSGLGKKPFLLYMQYMEPHYPWRPSSESLTRTMAGKGVPDLASLNSTYFVARRFPPAEESWEMIRATYDASVRDLDNELRQFFGELEAIGALENTYVVIIADHGEQLGDHGGLAGHGISLLNTETHVPFIVVPPQPRKRKDILDVISLVDLAPTIVTLAGLTPPPSFAGLSLHANFSEQRIAESAQAQRGAYSSLVRQFSADAMPPYQQILHRSAFVRDGRKLLETDSGDVQIYSLEEDPGEMAPLVLSRHDEPLKGAYDMAAAAARANASTGMTDEITAAMRDQLRALGYAE